MREIIERAFCFPMCTRYYLVWSHFHVGETGSPPCASRMKRTMLFLCIQETEFGRRASFVWCNLLCELISLSSSGGTPDSTITLQFPSFKAGLLFYYYYIVVEPLHLFSPASQRVLSPSYWFCFVLSSLTVPLIQRSFECHDVATCNCYTYCTSIRGNASSAVLAELSSFPPD